MSDTPSKPRTPEGDAKNGEPELMRRMAVTLGADHALKGVERRLAADKCHECTELEACRVWLDITSIRGAVHAPKFCRNVDLFEEISNDAASSTF
jgi:uncharacterized protein (DUF1810 family)